MAGPHFGRATMLKAALANEGRGDIMIAAGGVLPPQDHEDLKTAGAEAMSCRAPSVIAEAAGAVLAALRGG